MKTKKQIYNIYRFCFKKLFTYGTIREGVLEVGKIGSKMSLIGKYDGKDKKGDCLLFDQTCKALFFNKQNEDNFETIFINIDFSEIILSGEKLAKKLNEIPNGITLYIKEKKYTFTSFLKSNSMSKNCCVYFINKDVKDTIEPRITFNYNTKDLVLSKWYAYSGLSISDAMILDNIKFNEDEIVIVPDKEVTIDVECITAISIPFLLDRIKELYRYISEIMKNVHNQNVYYNDYINYNENEDKYVYTLINKALLIIKEFKSYVNSNDFNNLSMESMNIKTNFNRKHMFNILNVIKDLEKCSFKEIYSVLNNLIEEYALFNLKEREYYLNHKSKVSLNTIYWEKIHVYDYPIVVNKFDGEGLCDLELSKLINRELESKEIVINDEDEEIDSFVIKRSKVNEKDYNNGYSFQIRLPFIKGVVHACDFKKFFKERKINKIYGLSFDSNKVREYDIDNVKMILTESQFKAKAYIKSSVNDTNVSPLSNYFKLLNKYDYCLAISNLEPKNKSKVKLNYQFISTIPFVNRELDKLIENNEVRYLNKISKSVIASELAVLYPNDKKLIENNKEFYYTTKRFKDKENISEHNMLRDLLSIKLETRGYRKLICSDLLELLYHSMYHKDDYSYEFEYLNNYEFYAPNTKIKNEDGYDRCIILRNPHYSRNEIAVLKPAVKNKDSEREKYFGHLSGVVMVNPLSFTAERLGGADYDGDTVIILNNKYRSKTIEKLFNSDNKMKYPLVKIPSIQTGKVKNTFENIAKSFEDTFSSRIGLISYNAFNQSFSSYKLNENDTDEIMPFFTILSGLEIDSAKNGVKPCLIEFEENSSAKFFLDFNKSLKSSEVKLEFYENKIKELENEHTLFNMCSRIYQYKSKNRSLKQKIKLNKDNIKKEDVLKALGIYLTYEDIHRLKVDYYKYSHYIKEKNECINNILINISNILVDKKIERSISEVMSFFETENAIETLEKYYFSLEKYHYLFTKEERIKFIEDTLEIKNLPYDILEAVTTFDNNGVYLLYFILYMLKEEKYLNNKKDSIQIQKSNFDGKDINKLLKCLSSNVIIDNDDIIKINDYYSDFIDKIIEKNKTNQGNNKKEYLDILQENTVKVLRKEAKDLNSDSCISVFKNINNANVVLDVFNEQLLEVLNRKEVTTNG